MFFTNFSWFYYSITILINLSIQSFDHSNFYTFIEISLNSISVSFFGAFLTILISFIIIVAVKYHGSKKFSFFATIAGSGYAFPGVILALATTFFLSFIQNNINDEHTDRELYDIELKSLMDSFFDKLDFTLEQKMIYEKRVNFLIQTKGREIKANLKKFLKIF